MCIVIDANIVCNNYNIILAVTGPLGGDFFYINSDNPMAECH